MTTPKPQTLGLRRSFGFGDRLGLATPGHIDAVRGSGFAPIFAQQSIREMARTNRTASEVMASAVEAIESCDWSEPWGADADHIQHAEDIVRTAEAGFCYFTIDPSEHVNNQADSLDGAGLDAALARLAAEGAMAPGEAEDLYLGKRFDLGSSRIAFEDATLLRRAVVKYGAGLAHTRRMVDAIAAACGSRPFEVEMSVDETLTPTSPLEHLFIALELRRRDIRLVALAPRFIGDFEKGIDYKGDLGVFEEHYRLHADIAKTFGPYKISIHSGSDKFSIYPIIGRISGEHLHVKTAGTSYLEALRAISRTDRALFGEIIAFCRGRYGRDKATYHVSARLSDVPENIAPADYEAWYLNNPAGREILHVTYGSVLTEGRAADGGSFHEKIMENLRENTELYRNVLEEHLGKHLKLLG